MFDSYMHDKIDNMVCSLSHDAGYQIFDSIEGAQPSTSSITYQCSGTESNLIYCNHFRCDSWQRRNTKIRCSVINNESKLLIASGFKHYKKVQIAKIYNN